MNANRLIRIVVGCMMLCSATESFAAYTSARQLLNKPPDWYKGEEAAKAAAAVLSYQALSGGWPKNVDTAAAPYEGDRSQIEATYDNSATTDELRFIARMFNATKDERFHQSFMKGLEYVLSGQYPNGGWPQSNPPGQGYARYITFNDGAMARLMFFVREVANENTYDFVPADKRKACKEAWDKGVDCIVKCQIKVDGKLTAWCAQHDEKDFSPRPARTFELVSISGCETVGVVHALMNVEHPSPEVIQAVDAAVAWLDSVKIPGIKIVDKPDPDRPKGYHRIVVNDPSAPPLWARFYEIGTNRPIFSDRDSIKKYDLSEIGDERRNGYKWYGDWPKNLIAREYPEWKAKVSGTMPAPSSQTTSSGR
jgi:PelA/Pel-15E family pectate lyase